MLLKKLLTKVWLYCTIYVIDYVSESLREVNFTFT